jgi:Protoglobin
MPPDPSAIPGYGYGTGRVSRSPVTLEELAQLKNAAGLTEEDHHYLALAGEVLADQAEDMVSAWRAAIGANEHLAKWFQKPDGQPDDRYKAAVKPRFVQWVIDTCTRPYDQAWLDYQEEIGLRHTPEKKNATDHASAPPLVPLRYVVVFTSVIITTAREFLGNKGHTPEQIERMQAAWTKAVLLSVALWSRPFTKPGLW